MKAIFAVLLVLFLLPASAQAEVILNTETDFSGYGFTLKYDCSDFRPYTYHVYKTVYTGREQQNERTVWYYVSFNDRIKAVEVTNNETVVIYEAINYRGRYVCLVHGNGRYILPRWFWNRASSLEINEICPSDRPAPTRPNPSKKDPADHNGPPDHRRN
jgi:hypothetical protein